MNKGRFYTTQGEVSLCSILKKKLKQRNKMKKKFGIMLMQYLLYVFLSEWFLYGMIIAYLKLSGINSEYGVEVFFDSERLIWLCTLNSIMIIVLFLGTRSVKISLGRISHDKIWKMVGFASLVTLGLTLLEISFVSLIELSKLFPEEVEDLESFEELTNNIPGLISIGILTPIEEEIAFRGILVGGLLRMRCNPWVAIVASAVIFAFSHGYHVQFFGTMVFGVVAAWLYWRTKSLIPGIIIHIIHNSVSVVLNMIPFIEPGTEDDTDLSKMTLIIILLVSLSTLAVGLWWFKQKRYRSIKYSNKSQGQN